VVVLCDLFNCLNLTARSHRDLVARSRSYLQSSLVLLACILVAHSSIELSFASSCWQRTEISVSYRQSVLESIESTIESTNYTFS
jgi:hypothetical protein